jgi:hypothetical protein
MPEPQRKGHREGASNGLPPDPDASPPASRKAYKQWAFRISQSTIACRAFCNARLQKTTHVENTI